MSRALLLATLLLAGCSGGTVTVTVTTTQALPPLPRTTADKLAGEADAVAADLARDDGCAARDHAKQLTDDTIAAINDHEVPGAYQEVLLARAQSLQGQITCTPPAPAPEPAPGPPGKEKHPKHGHGHGKGGDG